VITPRLTRLVRLPSLGALQRAIAASALEGDFGLARDTAVIVPTRAAAATFERTLETLMPEASGALVLPDVVSRREWYDRLHARLIDPPRLLDPFEREVMLQAAAHRAITEGRQPPFHVRPPILAEMLALYDGLRRNGRTLEDFERVLIGELEAAVDHDRGAQRLLRQTQFLSFSFEDYERRLGESGAIDEHGLREHLLKDAGPRPFRQVVVAVGDRTADPDGLWPGDFDLLTRLPGLTRIDVVATEELLATGLHERLYDSLPGLEERRVDPVPDGDRTLLAPLRQWHFVSRDREEELVDLARRLKRDARAAPAQPLERVAAVFRRPLPYMYLAHETFGAAGLPFESEDALPLAAEPFAAALDLVFTIVSGRFSRRAIVSLLRSPHFEFRVDDEAVTSSDVAALDRALETVGFAGDAEALSRFVEDWANRPADPGGRRDAVNWPVAHRAARAALAVRVELAPLMDRAPASTQLDALGRFLAAHGRAPAESDPLRERLLRARHAILAIVDGLARAHHTHGDLAWEVDELASTVRRWIESQTFAPVTGSGGLRLLDAASARFADLDVVHVLGLVEGEWPERPRRNIFYSPFLLQQLGWPDARLSLPAARAAFLDLLRLARRRTSVSTFSLEHDTLVEPSRLLEEISAAGLPQVADDESRVPVFTGEALLRRPLPVEVLRDETARWAAMRADRSDSRLPAFHGDAGAQPSRTYSVGAIEQYTQCPFRYFSRYVLRLDEEREEQDGLSALERGRFMHEVFEAFFTAWQTTGHGAVRFESIAEARALFRDVSEAALRRLPPADAALERARLLGSPVAPGLGDLVFRMEAERAAPVIERRIEHGLDGPFSLVGPDGPREVRLRGIADRIDLLGDYTFRVVDYKTSLPARPLQLGLYAACVAQRLEGYRGRRWDLAEAVYLVFRGSRLAQPLGRDQEEREFEVLEAQVRAVEAVEGIERGAFGPRPVTPALCASCAFSGVCRKDVVIDEEPAPAV
jgi:RecB family exonuclease